MIEISDDRNKYGWKWVWIGITSTRIEPVGEPYREVCLSPWKGNWRISKNRIDWRNVLLSEKNYFHEKELKENGNMT